MGPLSHAELGNHGSILKWGITGIVLKKPFQLQDEGFVGDEVEAGSLPGGHCKSPGERHWGLRAVWWEAVVFWMSSEDRARGLVEGLGVGVREGRREVWTSLRALPVPLEG